MQQHDDSRRLVQFAGTGAGEHPCESLWYRHANRRSFRKRQTLSSEGSIVRLHWTEDDKRKGKQNSKWGQLADMKCKHAENRRILN
jgi:hypothetical protein